jgi:Autographiviridae endonuclease I
MKAGLRHGFRSGLEKANAEFLKSKGVKVILFEEVKIKYVVPAAIRTYTLDFELPNGIMVETKGIFDPTDRAKHLFLKTQHPDLDIRFVFSSPNAKISKGSSTRYCDWCDKYGFKWAAKVIPDEWLNEPGPHGQPGKAGGPRTIDVAKEVQNDILDPSRQPLSSIRETASRASQMARKATRAVRDRLSPDTRQGRRKASPKASR